MTGPELARRIAEIGRELRRKEARENPHLAAWLRDERTMLRERQRAETAENMRQWERRKQ